MGRSLYMPLQVGDLGVPRTAARTTSIRQQIEQLLFTIPGERVRRPDFGCGVQRLVFDGASPEIAGAVEYTIRLALQRSLSDLITVDAVSVSTADSSIFIDLLYTVIATGEEMADTFSRPLQGAP